MVFGTRIGDGIGYACFASVCYWHPLYTNMGIPLPSQLGFFGLSFVQVSSPLLFPPGLPSPMSSFVSRSFSSSVGPSGLSVSCGFPSSPPSYPPPHFPPPSPPCVGLPFSPSTVRGGVGHLHGLGPGGLGGLSEVAFHCMRTMANTNQHIISIANHHINDLAHRSDNENSARFFFNFVLRFQLVFVSFL